SAGHISPEDAAVLMADLETAFGSDEVTFYSGVSYRNLLVLHGKRFSPLVDYFKPDSSQDILLSELRLSAQTPEAQETVDFLIDLEERAAKFLANHPINLKKKSPANRIWPWSPGRRPALPDFSQKYQQRTGAIISAVDVIRGLGMCSNMQVIEVPGATGFVDTNYDGKAQAAIKAIEEKDFVYLHLEAIDECSHLGDLK
ncbi:MAG: phosphoglycerate mutase, partial [Lentisphaeria bacterium]|nr:phosphoglycerate mutase [Lentisphaeria bacterium]